MANTIKNVILSAGKKHAVIYITLASDGTEETDLVVYDSSAVATAYGDTDPLDSSIVELSWSFNAASTARAHLEWDATTDVLAHTIVASHAHCVDYRPIGGLPNQGATGKTGDILLTTTGMEAGDSLTLIMVIKRD